MAFNFLSGASDSVDVQIFRYLCMTSRTERTVQFEVMIPSTVVFRNCPTIWYDSLLVKNDAGHSEIEFRQKAGSELEVQTLFDHFGKETAGCDVVAYFVNEPQPGGGQAAAGDDSAKKARKRKGKRANPIEEEAWARPATPSVMYFGREELRQFLFSSETTKYGFLQKYIPSRVGQSETLQAVWSPKMSFCIKRMNRRRMADRSYPMALRSNTFDGDLANVTEHFVHPASSAAVMRVVDTVIEHVSLAAPSLSIRRIVAYFRKDASGVMWFLYTSSLRVCDSSEAKMQNAKIRQAPVRLLPHFGATAAAVRAGDRRHQQKHVISSFAAARESADELMKGTPLLRALRTTKQDPAEAAKLQWRRAVGAPAVRVLVEVELRALGLELVADEIDDLLYRAASAYVGAGRKEFMADDLDRLAEIFGDGGDEDGAPLPRGPGVDPTRLIRSPALNSRNWQLADGIIRIPPRLSRYFDPFPPAPGRKPGADLPRRLQSSLHRHFPGFAVVFNALRFRRVKNTCLWALCYHDPPPPPPPRPETAPPAKPKPRTPPLRLDTPAGALLEDAPMKSPRMMPRSPSGQRRSFRGAGQASPRAAGSMRRGEVMQGAMRPGRSSLDSSQASSSLSRSMRPGASQRKLRHRKGPSPASPASSAGGDRESPSPPQQRRRFKAVGAAAVAATPLHSSLIAGGLSVQRATPPGSPPAPAADPADVAVAVDSDPDVAVKYGEGMAVPSLSDFSCPCRDLLDSVVCAAAEHLARLWEKRRFSPAYTHLLKDIAAPPRALRRTLYRRVVLPEPLDQAEDPAASVAPSSMSASRRSSAAPSPTTPAPAPAPAPPATREPSGISIFGVRHHSSCSHAVEDAEAAVEGLGHAALSGATSWDGEAAAAAAGMLPPGQDAGRSTLPLADAHGARRQSSAAVPAKPLGGEGGGGGALGMVFPDGDFGKLGEFITSLCHEYRSQVALLRDELTRKATHCSSLEQRLQEHGGVYTPASRPMSDPASSALRSRSHYDDLRASNETLRVELAHSQREQNDSIVQLLDHKFANLTASLGDKDHVIAAYTARNAELERGGHDAQEHIASLQQQLAERELEMQEVKEHAAAAQAVVDQQAQQLRIKEETHRAVVEELEEQILALQIANEAKQTDALLLREAVSLAEKRASATEDAAAAAAAPPSAHATDGIYAHLSQRQKRVYDMAPEELQAFLGNVLQFCPETCAAFAGMTGLQMMNMPLPDLNKRFRAGEYSILCDALQLVPMAEEREKQRGRAASRSPSRVTVLNCDGADTPELMSWILASRGKMVEDIWRGYEKIKSCKTLLTSASRVLHRGDRFMKEDLKGILERGAAATKAAEKGLAAVVTEYFMDFEKLHLGVAGMRSSTRRAASRSRSPSRRDGARLTPTEKRMLARMTTALFRSTRDHQAGGQRAHSKPRREVAPSLPLSYHDARTPSKERIESPDRRGASASADDDLLRLPKPQEPADPAASAGDSAQVLYLTPPPTASLFTQATAPPPSSPPRSRDDPPPPPRAGFPRGRDLDARAAMRAAAHAGASRSPGASRGRASSPNVAFGRSALPRTPSPLTRRRSGSLHKAAVRTQSPQSAASGGPTRRLLGVGGDRGAARHGYVFGGGHREQSHSDRSSRAESVPLSAWHTDLKPDHVFQTHS
eukprot:TRINITY_DN4814_c0_g4_i1.p1 TRINITY_DN4814_c0_g4~~TRINITY_DN4814_c0_g4_i1.p1  ORF type:complete len:1658 (+),score=597.79 TRINITY_DN4814_c0_g4_i1:104-5077(+)